MHVLCRKTHDIAATTVMLHMKRSRNACRINICGNQAVCACLKMMFAAYLPVVLCAQLRQERSALRRARGRLPAEPSPAAALLVRSRQQPQLQRVLVAWRASPCASAVILLLPLPMRCTVSDAALRRPPKLLHELRWEAVLDCGAVCFSKALQCSIAAGSDLAVLKVSCQTPWTIKGWQAQVSLGLQAPCTKRDSM